MADPSTNQRQPPPQTLMVDHGLPRHHKATGALVAQFKEASHELRAALACGEVAPAVSFPEGGVPLFGGG